MHSADVALPLWSMYLKGITFHTAQGAAGLGPVLAAIAAGQIDPLVVEPTVVAWDDAAEAPADPGPALKTVLERA